MLSKENLSSCKKISCFEVKSQWSTEINNLSMTNVNFEYHAYSAIFPFPVMKVWFEGTKSLGI